MSGKLSNTRQRILEAACHLFAEHGYRGVSTRLIAQKAGVPQGSIHYHFGSKELLYTEVFRIVFDLGKAFTYDVLLQREPDVLETPQGKAYAIQLVVFDYFHRHLYIPEEWKRKLILRELFDNSPIYIKLIDEIMNKEAAKMTEFYYALCPDGSKTDCYYWVHIPDAQSLYYMMTGASIELYEDREFLEELYRNVIRSSAKTMIMLLELPLPETLK